MDYRELSEPDIIAILDGRFREYRLNCRLTQKELAQLVEFQKGMFGVPVQHRFPEERMGRVTD